MYQICIADTENLKQRAFKLREEVFLHEIGRDRVVEIDAYDANATHFVAVCHGEVVGALRIYLPEDNGIKIGRVVVRKDMRGQGIGSDLMHAAHIWARSAGHHHCYLHAEETAAGFYKKLGYQQSGSIFMEAGKPHIYMRYAL